MATAYEKLTTGLTDAAQQDHFTLRERIEVAGNQIAGLQQYIDEQCLN
ncbi:lysis system i-spanin subunit Rz [Pantoea agglomerans]